MTIRGSPARRERQCLRPSRGFARVDDHGGLSCRKRDGEAG
jgi:hypothetical protein